MTTPSPVTPPNPPVPDVRTAPDKRLRYVVAISVAVQLVATLIYSPVCIELVRSGAATPLALLLGVLGSICLYSAAILAVTTRSRGRLLFILAAIGFGVSADLWGWLTPCASVALYG